MLIRCAKRRVDRSGQARHPRLRAGGAARDGAAGPCGGTSGAEGLERAAACLHIAALEPGTSSPHQRTAPARDFAQQSWKGLEGRRGLGRLSPNNKKDPRVSALRSGGKNIGMPYGNQKTNPILRTGAAMAPMLWALAARAPRPSCGRIAV